MTGHKKKNHMFMWFSAGGYVVSRGRPVRRFSDQAIRSEIPPSVRFHLSIRKLEFSGHSKRLLTGKNDN